MFSILERLAVDEYGARMLTVDTRAYQIPWASEGETSYLRKWYERRGYVEFRVSRGARGSRADNSCEAIRNSPLSAGTLKMGILNALIVQTRVSCCMPVSCARAWYNHGYGRPGSTGTSKVSSIWFHTILQLLYRKPGVERTFTHPRGTIEQTTRNAHSPIHVDSSKVPSSDFLDPARR